MDESLREAKILLEGVSGKSLTREARIEKTFELAALLTHATEDEKTASEKRQEAWMGRMMADEPGKALITAMTDQILRCRDAKRSADQLHYLIQKWGIPRFFTSSERLKFKVFTWLGPHFPKLFMSIIRKQIHKETSQVILPEDRQKQLAYFAQKYKENVRLNINHIGEAILGEEEALRRLKIYLEDLANPQIEYVSIKISTIFSQINMIAFDQSLEILASRLRLLYNAAEHNTYKRADGTEVQKFVNLDMEEYRDLDLTVALFKKVLSESPHLHTSAGIVLQSYLPDTFAILQDLTQWAQRRVKEGGAPIRIRIVKGANLAMEMVESSLRGWNLATFDNKLDTDAQFKQMVEFATRKEHAEAVHIGVASHNLFEIAYTLLLRAENGTTSTISFEMLEGMAKPLQRVIHKISGGMLLYCPEAKEKDFHTAIAYLIRRLDENSGPENFLRHFFEMKPGNDAWEEQKKLFIASCRRIDALQLDRKRTQNRNLAPEISNLTFHNEPDTDFSLPENRKWAYDLLKEWESKKHSPIPLVINGKHLQTTLEQGVDPSKPDSPAYQYSLADLPLIDKALSCASEYESKWASLPYQTRYDLLGKAAQLFRARRGELIGAMVADGGKTVWEADPEVSEAVDFIEYYRKEWLNKQQLPGINWKPKGTTLVASPWNFPCAIPVGGIAAALTAGNCVIFKSAPEAVLVGWYLAQAFWDAGIPKEALQFINCKDEPVGSYLIKHPKIASVILTGATQTAKKFLQMRPGLDLHAETGGKNSVIVTVMSDRDLAARDIISSAFGHSGQKCSACSLAILETEVYDDPDFKRQLVDAAKSLKVASAWNPSAKMTPLINPPGEALLRGLTTLEPGETWALEPKQDPSNPHLWSPGIKWGVQEKSFTHTTELFGPVLGVMRAHSLPHALELANATPYGLTSGLHSLDEREHALWKAQIMAGNLYINRGITGAIVRRQPFGGCKASSFGSGAKAGGPNYVQQLATATSVALPSERSPIPSLLSSLPLSKLSPQEQEVWKVSGENYTYWATKLKTPVDPSQLRGQDNQFYHVPLTTAYLRFNADDSLLALLQVTAACLLCNTPLQISSAIQLPPIPGVKVIIEEESSLLNRRPPRIRLLSPPSPTLLQGASQAAIILQHSPVLPHGQLELLHYLREVAVSTDYHRYGFLGLR